MFGCLYAYMFEASLNSRPTAPGISNGMGLVTPKDALFLYNNSCIHKSKYPPPLRRYMFKVSKC